MGEILEGTGEILVEIDNLSSIDSSDVFTEIEVNPINRFRAKYKLIAVGNNDKDTEITSRILSNSDSYSEIRTRAYSESRLDTLIDIKYRGNSVVLTEIQPIGYNNLNTEIEIRPHNRMMAIYEVQQPPIITNVFNPTQDAFTREKSDFSSINYGGNSSMVAGISNDDIWRSFIQFDLSSINSSYVLVDTKLRLYYKGVVPSNLQLEMLNADDSWQEYNITNLNRPKPIKLISNEFTLHNGYIEFNVNDIVKDWVALKTDNNGFILRIANETQLGQVTFHTRESVLPPELVVSYYDSTIFSQGRSQIVTEMFVYNRRESDKNAEITVDSVYNFRKVDVELYVHRVEVPIPNEILTEITVSKPYVHTEFIVTIHVDNDIHTEIDSRLGKEDNINTEIRVSRQIVNSEIFVKHIDSLPVEVTSRVLREDKVNAEITVSREYIFAEITARISDSSDVLTELSVNREFVLAEITVPIYNNSEVLTQIEANSLFVSKVLTEILVSKDTAKAQVEVRVGRLNNLYASITVIRQEVSVEIEVRYRSDIWVEIEPNIKSDVLTEIIATKPFLEAEISVFGYSRAETNTEIYVSNLNEIETEIFAHKISQIETEIDANSVSQINVEIIANKTLIFADIDIPTWVDLDINTEIEPRIMMVKNIYTIIQVGSVGGAYAFII